MALAGKVALVTGAARGIGRGVALQLSAEKATVYITSRRPEDRDDEYKKHKFPTLEETAREVSPRLEKFSDQLQAVTNILPQSLP